MTRLIPPGSSVYYSLRFLPQAQQHAISSLFSFSQEIEKVLYSSESPQVVELKLQWWQQELASARFSHPLLKMLQPVIAEHAITINVLQEVLAGLARRLSSCSYPNFKTYSEQHYRAISSFPLWVALVMTPTAEPKPLLFVHDLGIFLQTVEVIHDLRRDLQHGCIFLPEQDIDKYQVKEQELLALKPSTQLTELLADIAQQACTYHQQAVGRLAASQRHYQAPSLILAELYSKLLTEIAKDNYSVLERQVFLSPIRKLWLAWRMHNKLRK